jgi:hypothetical protein
LIDKMIVHFQLIRVKFFSFPTFPSHLLICFDPEIYVIKHVDSVKRGTEHEEMLNKE